MSLQFDHPFKDRTFYNFNENLLQPRHRWYPFKEGFSHQLVREAINQLQPKSKRSLRILDPFAGSGTTALTAALLGHQAVAVEVNPFCSFASKTKCVPGRWRERGFRETVNQVLSCSDGFNAPSPLEEFSTFSEWNGNTKWLFNKDVLRVFAAITRRIDQYGGTYAQALQLAAIRAVMLCCNGKKDGKCLRYYRDWKQRSYSKIHFLQAFRAATEVMLEDVKLCPIPRSAHVAIVTGDARSVLGEFTEKSFDLIVTSPPYLNSFDYSDLYRPELFLGGFVSNNEELRKIRLQTIRSHVQVKWKEETDPSNDRIQTLVTILGGSRGLWNRRLPQMVEAYFQDMHKILVHAARVLRRGGEAWIVVSTSAYEGCQIPVDLIIADLGREAGFDLKGIFVLRQLRGSGQQWARFASGSPPLRESLIILRR